MKKGYIYLIRTLTITLFVCTTVYMVFFTPHQLDNSVLNKHEDCWAIICSVLIVGLGEAFISFRNFEKKNFK